MTAATQKPASTAPALIRVSTGVSRQFNVESQRTGLFAVAVPITNIA